MSCQESFYMCWNLYGFSLILLENNINFSLDMLEKIPFSRKKAGKMDLKNSGNPVLIDSDYVSVHAFMTLGRGKDGNGVIEYRLIL